MRRISCPQHFLGLGAAKRGWQFRGFGHRQKQESSILISGKDGSIVCEMQTWLELVPVCAFRSKYYENGMNGGLTQFL